MREIVERLRKASKFGGHYTDADEIDLLHHDRCVRQSNADRYWAALRQIAYGGGDGIVCRAIALVALEKSVSAPIDREPENG